MIRTILWVISSAYFFAVGVAFLIMASNANAQDITPSDIQRLVAEKSLQTGTGVILAISPRGPEAAETAYLLAVQASNNPDYAPLLLIPGEHAQLDSIGDLELTIDQLPALIFFSAQGKELGRLVSSNNAPQYPALRNNHSALTVKN